MNKPNRNNEERYEELINFIIDHPNCNTSQIQQTVRLKRQYLNEIILSMRSDRLISIKTIKSLRRGARLITITRKGIEQVYGKLIIHCEFCKVGEMRETGWRIINKEKHISRKCTNCGYTEHE
jgi:predicted transcriptional regulator